MGSVQGRDQLLNQSELDSGGSEKKMGLDRKLPSRLYPGVPPAHLPSKHVLLSSPADAARCHGALLPVLGRCEPAFGAGRAGPDLLRRRRLGSGRIGRWRLGLGLAGRALSPERHAAQPHQVGLETQSPPAHRGQALSPSPSRAEQSRPGCAEKELAKTPVCRAP